MSAYLCSCQDLNPRHILSLYSSLSQSGTFLLLDSVPCISARHLAKAYCAGILQSRKKGTQFSLWTSAIISWSGGSLSEMGVGDFRLFCACTSIHKYVPVSRWTPPTRNAPFFDHQWSPGPPVHPIVPSRQGECSSDPPCWSTFQCRV